MKDDLRVKITFQSLEKIACKIKKYLKRIPDGVAVFSWYLK